MKTEEWRSIEGWEGYEVSNLGNVRSYIKHGKIINEHHNFVGKSKRSGYYRADLQHKSGKSKTHSIHRLVALTFIPNLSNKSQVNHINGIKTDNRVDNLEWVTASENAKHCIRIGLKKDFNRKPIIQLKITGEVVKKYGSTEEASKATGLNRKNICKVVNGENHTAGGYKWKFA